MKCTLLFIILLTTPTQWQPWKWHGMRIGLVVLSVGSEGMNWSAVETSLEQLTMSDHGVGWRRKMYTSNTFDVEYIRFLKTYFGWRRLSHCHV
jgi:hypothetical protein